MHTNGTGAAERSDDSSGDNGSDDDAGSGVEGVVFFPCGWDAELGLCLTGEDTTQEESDALLEAEPGGCSHQTGAPSVSPTMQVIALSSNAEESSNSGVIVVVVVLTLL